MATDINLIIKQNKYEETRRRISRFKNAFSISDKEIIEYLAEEIEQYRNRIKNQDKIINELSKKKIQSEEETLKVADNELLSEDIIEIITTTQYADGKPIISKMEYKYREK